MNDCGKACRASDRTYGGVVDGMGGHVVANGVDDCARIGDKFAAVVQRGHNAVCQL